MKEKLRSALRNTREVFLWKVESLGEYDLRRPMTRTGTNLPGVMKHVAVTDRHVGGLGDVGKGGPRHPLVVHQLTRCRYQPLPLACQEAGCRACRHRSAFHGREGGPAGVQDRRPPGDCQATRNCRSAAGCLAHNPLVMGSSSACPPAPGDRAISRVWVRSLLDMAAPTHQTSPPAPTCTPSTTVAGWPGYLVRSVSWPLTAPLSACSKLWTRRLNADGLASMLFQRVLNDRKLS